MKTVDALVVGCACALLGGFATAAPGAAPPGAAAVELPQILEFNVIQIDVPVAAGGQVQIAVPLGGQPFVMSLAPHSIRSPDFQLLVDSGDGTLQPMEPAPPRTYRGWVEGLAGSSVAASLIDGRLWASILTGEGEAWNVEPLSELVAGAAPGSHVVYRGQDVVPADRMCGTSDRPAAPAPQGGPDGGIAGSGLKIAEIAADADVEYWTKNGSSVVATMADIENVLAASSNVYEAEIGVTYEVTTIVVRTGDVSADPYSTSVCSPLLGQFRSKWAAAPEVSIRRDLAELFTGRVLSDCLGIAYLGGACDSTGGFGYSVVESKSTGLPFSQRVGLTSHETGHNWNAPHCCAGCAGCTNPPCTIMCPCIGGCSGNVSTFLPLSAQTIINFVNASSCLHPLPDPLILPFSDDFPGATLNPSNWIYIDGAGISALALNEPSPPNSMRLEAFGNGSGYQDHEVRTNFINLTGLADAGVFARFSTEHVGSEAGETLFVDYWTGAIQDRWDPLTSIVSDGVDQSQFQTTTVPLDGLLSNPFHGEFRLRFYTDVDIPPGDSTNDNWFIDDVFIGITPPPDNDLCALPSPVSEGSFPFTTDGAHTDGLPEFCGTGNINFVNDIWFLYTPSCDGTATVSLCNAADFDTRIAVYTWGNCPPSGATTCNDDAGGCGQTSQAQLLVFSFLQYAIRVGATSGTGSGTLTISCVPTAPPCPWDVDGDDSVGIVDFLDLLSAWGPNPGHPADFNGDGNVGIVDFLELLGHWGPC